MIDMPKCADSARSLGEREPSHHLHGSVEAAKGVSLKLTVVCDPGRNQRMSDLHKKSPHSGQTQQEFSIDIPEWCLR